MATGERLKSSLDCADSPPITPTIRWQRVDSKITLIENLFQTGERERRLKSPFAVQQ